MKITAISSSPRKGGNSDILTDRMVAAAKDAGATVEKLRIGHLDIGGCTACNSCQKSIETPCAYDDAAQPILAAIKAADCIVFAAPIYNFAVAAQLKLLLDRMYSFGGGGRWDALAGRRLGVILTYADKDRSLSGVANAIGMFRDMARFIGVEIAGIVEASCDEAGDVKEMPEALREADQLGRTLSKVS